VADNVTTVTRQKLSKIFSITGFDGEKRENVSTAGGITMW
jgi:hypothetical protein